MNKSMYGFMIVRLSCVFLLFLLRKTCKENHDLVSEKHRYFVLVNKASFQSTAAGPNFYILTLSSGPINFRLKFGHPNENSVERSYSKR